MHNRRLFFFLWMQTGMRHGYSSYCSSASTAFRHGFSQVPARMIYDVRLKEVGCSLIYVPKTIFLSTLKHNNMQLYLRANSSECDNPVNNNVLLLHTHPLQS